MHRTVVKVIFCLFSLCVCFFYTRAQNQAYDFQVFFRVSDTTVDRNYLDNPGTFDRLDNVLSLFGDVAIDTVRIVAKSSPEGSRALNMKLANGRAAAMKSYIEKHHPGLAGKIIIDAGISPWPSGYADKKALAKLRYTKFSLVFQSGTVPVLCDDRIIVLQDFIPVEPDEISAPEDEFLPFELEPIIVNIPEYRQAIKRIPVLALSTNMLYDLAITPNFAVEFPLGKHWSMLGEYTFPWWVTRDNTRAWQILKWDLGARYWFHTPAKDNPMDVLRGHFLGLDLSAGYYDIEPYHTGWQGEFQAAGLEYGYAWTLGDFWRIEAFIGGGWMGTHYRYYEGNKDDSKLMYKDTDIKPWNFGPIKLGVSIKYVLSRKQRRDGK